MSKKKQKKQEERLGRKYSHPEFLKEFFPNVSLDELDSQDDTVLPEDQFPDFLDKVSNTVSMPLDES